MADTQEVFQLKLQAIRKAYIKKLPGKLKEIQQSWQSLQGDANKATPLNELHRLVHSLVGSAGTFGFERLSTEARVVERALKAQLESEQPPSEGDWAKIDGMIAALAQLDVGAPPAQATPSTEATGSVPLLFPEGAARFPLIYLVEDDTNLAQELALQVENFGYRVRTFDTCEKARAAMPEQTPAAVIMDIMFPEGPAAGIAAALELKNCVAEKPPVIFISARGDLETRLSAARAGGDAYFTKPVNISSLIERVDTLTQKHKPVPYRILVVDDEPELAERYALVLRQSEMAVQTLSDPMKILDAIAEFRPDLILMDIYMPKCTGVELAKVIRQNDAYLGIPIVFLSTETDVDKQFRALSLGGDGFLTKPINDTALINSVLVRAERSRILSTAMIKDSLTGLLNHTTTKERVADELARAQRMGNELSLAMIDIDRFKTINDVHGHGAGDRVIISLARLLQQRLRNTDIIGRYGGEEFVVLLPGTSLDAAQTVLDELRTKFSQIIHMHESDEFKTTFSAGVTSSARHQEMGTLLEAADAAMYRAKEAGRNQVVIDAAS